MRTIRRRGVRLQSYVDPELSQRVDRFCAATGFGNTWMAPAMPRSCCGRFLQGDLARAGGYPLPYRLLFEAQSFVSRFGSSG